MAMRKSFYDVKSYSGTNRAATSLTGQQKAERGRTRMREISKMNALDKSIVLKKPMKSKNKNAGKHLQ